VVAARVGELMAGFTDDVMIEVDEEQVLNMLFRLDVATSQIGFASWATTEIDPWLQMRARDRFKGEGDGASGKWRSLSTLTQEWRFMQGYPASHPINVRSGALRDYVESADGQWLSEGHEGGRYVWPEVALPYTNYIAAKLHTANVGRRRGENRLFPNASTPKRPAVVADQTDLRALLESYANYVETFVGESAGVVTVSGMFGGTINTPATVRGSAYSAGGGDSLT
jgi:hypothetical protein